MGWASGPGAPELLFDCVLDCESDVVGKLVVRARGVDLDREVPLAVEVDQTPPPVTRKVRVWIAEGPRPDLVLHLGGHPQRFDSTGPRINPEVLEHEIEGGANVPYDRGVSVFGLAGSVATQPLGLLLGARHRDDLIAKGRF
jgi:hypothetical protein